MYSFCATKESTQKSKYKDELRENNLLSIQGKYYYLDPRCPIECSAMMEMFFLRYSTGQPLAHVCYRALEM